MYSVFFPYKRVLIWLCIAFIPSLYGETLRSKIQPYFETLQWAQWNEEHTFSPIEPYTMSKEKPVAYAQSLSETAVYPSLSPLGLLDYHDVSKDTLEFYDIVADGFLKGKLNNSVFNPQKPFLVHLVRFILGKLPKAVYVFYSKPVLSQEGTTHADFKMITEEWIAFKQTENQQQEDHHTTTFEPEIKTAKRVQESTNLAGHIHEKKQHVIPPIFSDEKPYAVIIEVAAIKKGKKWYIDYVDIKGAEYANSSFEN